MLRTALLTAVVFTAFGCATARRFPVPVSSDRPAVNGDLTACANCATPTLEPKLASAIANRLADLKARGGECAVYGAVLENSFRRGQITIRPFMWRVGSQLASGEARPDGEMIVAREIDMLNAGVRTLQDLLWTIEHEAAHIAFSISNAADRADDRANAQVRGCR